MSEEKNDLENKVKELQRELEWLEAKFYRSGVNITVRLKTLLRMQKLTHEFLVWLVRSGLEEAKARTKEEEQVE